MNKILLIIQREFLNRVQKKSFLIATILLPLIFPAIMAILVYVAIEQKKNAAKEIIYYVDDSGFSYLTHPSLFSKNLMSTLTTPKKHSRKMTAVMACCTSQDLICSSQGYFPLHKSKSQSQ